MFQQLFKLRTCLNATGTNICRVTHLQQRTSFVLGIESTFDDTGAAVVDSSRNVLAEALHTQLYEHIKTGGVDPRIAQKIHRKHLPLIVEAAMSKAGIRFKDLLAVATATKPGLAYCLAEGLAFSKQLVAKHKLPFIPVHHMEAHLLTPRIMLSLDFPYLCLLVSGGHCILSIAHCLGKYDILGESLDEPPGAVFDKVARAMRIVERRGEPGLSNGADLEEMAKTGNRKRYDPSIPFATRHDRSCHFSFSGIQTATLHRLETSKECDFPDIAAWFQYSMFRHILKGLHRGIIFCKKSNLLNRHPTLVVSGGVACNAYFRQALTTLCEVTEMRLVTPPVRLCRDNGVMIAWTGMEYYKAGMGISRDPLAERFEPKCALGRDISDRIVANHLAVPKINYFID